MYVLTLCDRWMKVHYLEAMAVPHIYTGQAAKCPKNMRKRFMKTYTPLSGELHQTGEATDVCIGADYPQLQPKHIEREMGDGPLHIYQSVFGCRFVLRGVEPAAMPADEAAVTAVEVAAAVGMDPMPAAAQEMELETPGAAPAAVETSSPPVAAQEAAPAAADKGLLPTAAPEDEMEAAPAAADEGLPTMVAQETELEIPGAAPTAVEASLPPEAAQEESREEKEVRAAPAGADGGLLPMAAPEMRMEVPEEEEAAPAAVDKGLPPMAAPEDEMEAATVAEGGLPPMAAQEDKMDATEEGDAAGAAPAAVTEGSLPAAAPEVTTGEEETAEEAGGQVADRSPPLAPAPRGAGRPWEFGRR